MNYILLVFGVLLLFIAVSDLIYTTFSPNGAGYFTDIVTQSFYRFAKAVCIKTDSMKTFENIGTLLIGVILIFWYLAVWIGSSMIFCSDPQSVVERSTGAPADIVEKFYYTGFTLSTLGIGDYVADSNAWRIFTVLLSFTGFVLITAGISYMLPVLSATVAKRELGSYIAVLGDSPLDILQKQWENENFKNLEMHFDNLIQLITHHSQQLLAYPVVHCFYTDDEKKAAALNIARLDEAITIMLYMIPAGNRPSDRSLYPLREAITQFITNQKNLFVDFGAEEPQIPCLDSLEEAGIPLLYDQDQIESIFHKKAERRKTFRAILNDKGREFDQIYSGKVKILKKL